jgi:hypothetical protein
MELAVEQAGRYVPINNAGCGISCAEPQTKTLAISFFR